MNTQKNITNIEDIQIDQDTNSPIGKVIKYIIENVENNISLNDLAQVAGYSKYHFHRYFKQELHTTPIKWLWTYRLELGFHKVKNDPYPCITEIALSCGFCTPSHFSDAFKSNYGMTPSMAIKKFNKGINFASSYFMEKSYG